MDVADTHPDGYQSMGPDTCSFGEDALLCVRCIDKLGLVPVPGMGYQFFTFRDALSEDWIGDTSCAECVCCGTRVPDTRCIQVWCLTIADDVPKNVLEGEWYE